MARVNRHILSGNLDDFFLVQVRDGQLQHLGKQGFHAHAKEASHQLDAHIRLLGDDADTRGGLIQAVGIRALAVTGKARAILFPALKELVELVGRCAKVRLYDGLHGLGVRRIATDNAARTRLQQVIDIHARRCVDIGALVDRQEHIVLNGADSMGAEFLRLDGEVGRAVTEEAVRARDRANPCIGMTVNRFKGRLTVLVDSQLATDKAYLHPLGNTVHILIQLDIDFLDLNQVMAAVRACALAVRTITEQADGFQFALRGFLVGIVNDIAFLFQLKTAFVHHLANHGGFSIPTGIAVHTHRVRRDYGVLNLLALGTLGDGKGQTVLLIDFRLTDQFPAVLQKHDQHFLGLTFVLLGHILGTFLDPSLAEADLLNQGILEPVVHMAEAIVLHIVQMVDVRLSHLSHRLVLGALGFKANSVIGTGEHINERRKHPLNGISHIG